MRAGVEVGGTFTDLVAVAGGKVVVTKVPSTPKQPRYRRASMRCARLGPGDLARIEDLGPRLDRRHQRRAGAQGRARLAFVATAGLPRHAVQLQRHDRRN